jgi:CubicO group peptidase (beta-lactamase class C family)
MKCSSTKRMLWAVLMAASLGSAQAEPDEVRLGKELNYPVGNAINWNQNPHRVGSWSAMDRVPGILTRVVPPSTQPLALPSMANPPVIRYTYQGQPFTLADYLDHRRATGLLILKDGQIVAEHYRYGRTEDARFLSFSMSKSITSLLVGVAAARGLLQLDDKAEKHLPALAGSAYGGTTLRQLLRMSSGLTFTERYDGRDDIARLARAGAGVPGAGSPIDVLRSIEARHSPAGEKFVYSSAETDVLGRVLAAAAGRNVAELTREWLWQPMGAERGAFWRIDLEGQEMTYGGFNASLRDWGRLGLLLAQDGQRKGADGAAVQVLPTDFLLDATDATRQPPAFRPRQATPFFGYGYQFWLQPGTVRAFTLQGIHGQMTYVLPGANLVMVHTAAFESASAAGGGEALAPYLELGALWQGVVQALAGRR